MLFRSAVSSDPGKLLTASHCHNFAAYVFPGQIHVLYNIDGIYAAGDQLFASDCAGFACSTGYYAGRKAADYSDTIEELAEIDQAEVDAERERLYAPMNRTEGVTWKELNMAISKAMQNYCGGVKNDDLLIQGIDLLKSYREEIVPQLSLLIQESC